VRQARRLGPRSASRRKQPRQSRAAGMTGWRRARVAGNSPLRGRHYGRDCCRARLPRHRPQPVPAVTPPGCRVRELAATVSAPGAPIAARRSQNRAGTPHIVRVGPSSLNGAPHPRWARTRLRRAVDPGASADPAGLTARARPEARPEARGETSEESTQISPCAGPARLLKHSRYPVLSRGLRSRATARRVDTERGRD
jgi:hypothetical protein